MNEKIAALIALSIICIFAMFKMGYAAETVVGTAVGAIAGFITGAVTTKG